MNFKENESAEKLRGGYYTPMDLAVFLSKWVVEKRPKSVLEPSCGDGVFLEALSGNLPSATSVTAIEVNEEEATKARAKASAIDGPTVDVLNADFLEWYLSSDARKEGFDCVVGNPPFIRYQYLSPSDQTYSAEIFRRHGLRFTKHTNAWVPFVIASIALLKPGGRLAMVLPAEIMHVLHAQSLRNFVGQQCSQVLIFDPEEIWFAGTLQGAVLFLAEKKTHKEVCTRGLGIVPVRGKSFLNTSPTDTFRTANLINGRTVEGKWTKALLSSDELDIFEGLLGRPDVHRFNDIAEVDVGVVTGANKFFLVNNATVRRHGLDKWSHPMFGRSEHCPGVLYDANQHDRNVESGLPSNFIWFNVSDAKDLSDSALEYVLKGETENLHTRYKCRIRKPWFRVPSVYATQVGMLKRAHDMPRLIYNELEAYTTDTAYRVRTKTVEAKKLVFCFLNSLTVLSAELEGRHYGGGVLELVPSEIEKLVIPVPQQIRPALKRLDQSVRNLTAHDILDMQDESILRKMGLSTRDTTSLREGWNRLRNRRQRTSEDVSQSQ